MLEITESGLSEKLYAQALELIPGGVNSPVRAFRSVGGTPFFTVKAEGAYLTTADKRDLIDYVCTWGPAILGHNHPAPREAIAHSLSKGTSFGTPNPLEVEMAELLVARVPSLEKVRMVNSGTEACMSCIRLARGYTRRDKIIKFAGCYHGHVDAMLVEAGSGALTFGNPSSAGIPRGAAQDTMVLPYNDIEAVETAFTKYGEDIAAVMLEPYAGNCGFIPAKNEFLQRLRNLTTEYGSLLIFDEVMTGFRIAEGGVQSREAILPDLTALGKIIGGGLPVGAFGGKSVIMDQLAPDGPVYQAGTLSGNPLAVSAGIAMLTTLHELNPYKALEQNTRDLSTALTASAMEKGLPIQIPYSCGMLSVFFSEEPVQNLADVKNSNIELFPRFFQYALEKGVFLPPSPFEAWFFSIAHDSSVIEKTIDILTDALEIL